MSPTQDAWLLLHDSIPKDPDAVDLEFDDVAAAQLRRWADDETTTPPNQPE